MDEYKSYNNHSNDHLNQSINDYHVLDDKKDAYCFKEHYKTNKKKYTIKKIISLGLIALLIGMSFQVGMEVSKPLIGKYISPLLPEEVEKTTEFSFNDVQDVNMNGTNENKNSLNNLNNSSDNIVNFYSPVVDIATNVAPSIVSITSTLTTRDWFNNEFNQEGTGSGIIFGENENVIFIVTNYHVVEGADKVDITFIDDESVRAHLIGYDKEYDLAVLSVKKNEMKKETINEIRIAKLGNSDTLQVGELAVAIGNPLGKEFNNTVTVGVVSGNRTIELTDKKLGLIQTDAAINPGNSGGALVNSKGEVIGINSYKLASTEVEGMGFAITINEAKPIIEDIVNNIDRPLLGIEGKDITEEKSEFYDIPIGVLIVNITPDSGAEKAGMQVEDIIFEFNGVKIFNFQDLSQEISKYKAGDEVKVKVARMNRKGEFEKVELVVRLTDRSAVTMPY